MCLYEYVILSILKYVYVLVGITDLSAGIEIFSPMLQSNHHITIHIS